MPIYEYRCDECEQIFEEWQKDFEERDMPCPVCGNRCKRIMSNTTFVLKGTGWYVTDYAKSGASAPSNANGNGNGNGNGSKPAPEGSAASSDASASAPPAKAKEAKASSAESSK